MTTNQDTPTPVRQQRRRRLIPLFILLGILCLVAAIFAAKGHDLFEYGWPEWLCTGFISFGLHWWFGYEV
jgi:hypothetical protein